MAANQDAMNSDVDETLATLADSTFVPEAQQTAVRQIAARWAEHRFNGRIRTVSDGFWTQPAPYGQLVRVC